MDGTVAGQDAWLWNAEEIGESGERVSHLCQDATYYGHLSIYHFAASFCLDGRVLDAGCGSGYGSAFLADAGARHVLGIDASERAIAFSRYHFARPNLSYEVLSAERVAELAPGQFDLIYTSNTLEHVPDVMAFFHGCVQVIAPGGLLLVAVPPITDDRLLYLNLINPYHVNLWSPRQWAFALGRFFAEVQPYLHGIERIGADFRPEHLAAGSSLTAEGFVIAPGTVDDMYRQFTLTAIFVARKPRPASELPTLGSTPQFVDDSFTREAGDIELRVRARLGRYFEPNAGELRPARTVGNRMRQIWQRLASFGHRVRR